jgi:anhydro-N-acetylmuramic acid kinase
MSKPYLSLGLMSGTSMDGVDVSIIQSDGETQYNGLYDRFYEYSEDIYNNLSNLRDKITKNKKPNNNKILLESLSQEFNEIEKKITLFHLDIVSEVLKETNLPVDLIGFHGQTIFHNPEEKTPQKNKSIQLGNGKLLSKLLNKTVVYNFRENDLKNGGAGAPLTPIFHLLLAKKKLKQNELPALVLNLGGIANITLINNFVNNENSLYASDIGPGNCLIDKWVRKKIKEKYDESGSLAKSGKVNKVILDKAIRNWINGLENNFKHPVSHDIGDYDYSFANNLSLEDGAATITAYSSEIYSHFINKITDDNSYPKLIIVCGGGRKNEFLMKSFQNKVNCPLVKIDDFNIDGDFIESQAFAYLAIRSFLKLPISFPSTTGVKMPCNGGHIIKVKK